MDIGYFKSSMIRGLRWHKDINIHFYFISSWKVNRNQCQSFYEEHTVYPKVWKYEAKIDLAKIKQANTEFTMRLLFHTDCWSTSLSMTKRQVKTVSSM